MTPGKWPRQLLASFLPVLLATCASTSDIYLPPHSTQERAFVYFELPEPFTLSTIYIIDVLEIDRLEVRSSLPSEEWRQLEKPAAIDAERTRAIPVSPGTHKLLLGACRSNFVPFCDSKCAKAVLRVDAAANTFYEVSARVGDDKSKFKIVEASNGVVVSGPERVDSRCSILATPR